MLGQLCQRHVGSQGPQTVDDVGAQLLAQTHVGGGIDGLHGRSIYSIPDFIKSIMLQIIPIREKETSVNRSSLAGKSIALACALAAAPAFSQSSVAIYGRVDLGVFHQNSGTTPINAGIAPPGPPASMWQVRQGSAGRLGFRGTEDLGGGWQASFLMEHRFQGDTGQSEIPFFQARSFVELGAPKTWGSVYAGREYIPAFWPALRLDPWGFDSVGTPGPKHQLANYL
ncbi:MAG: porin, partial [Burkholderiales bacterium]